MAPRSLYLAKSRRARSQRAHFALFIPDATSDRATLSRDYAHVPSRGTIVHVVGEPVLSGFVQRFKRNYNCAEDPELEALVRLGEVDSAILYEPENEVLVEEGTPRGGRESVEREAMFVAPPPRGQDVRAPVDGIAARRCQEWTMELLQRLVDKGYIGQEAFDLADAERDSPTHGIFGQRDRVR